MSATPYRVLARKYRPQRFEDLIGQEPMVRTLTNAFASNRIAQAWILTGVRGVGKTTTARILARALNYETAEGGGGPTVDLSVPGVHCEAIMESRHVDVVEMDAASHTGVADVRQILETVHYAPVMARYKVFIIDEVHMLSTSAFNAFLKTLEEPPPHVKFVFATTEIRKVPVTVLSRCQSFSLRRVAADELSAHLKRICDKENVAVEDEALAVVSRAAEGSVRDALSLLDQAIAHGQGDVRAEAVRGMLGLADRAGVLDLFDAVMRGDTAAALDGFRGQYDVGADPVAVLTDLAETVHLVTRIKLAPRAADDPSLSEAERLRGRDFAERLSMRVLSRAWQMLLKGISEVQVAPKPAQAADMVLVRLAHVADLPTPDEAIRMLDGAGAPPQPPAPPRGGPPMGPSGGSRGPEAMAPARMTSGAAVAREMAPEAAQAPPRAQQAQTQPIMRLSRFEDLVALAAREREIQLHAALLRQVRVVRFEDGVLEFQPTPDATSDLAGAISKKLQEWTGQRWMVAVAAGEGAPTIHEREQAEAAARLEGVQAHPHVRAILDRMPGAVIVDVRARKPEPETAELDAAAVDALPAADDDIDDF
ncbi:DNA polymerase-3 subunit gamma/tau [Methylopila capsulata]|uniref:DNA polymerase III subunit gamma/tau n=1 Tax=Methylopila capsulata TaxID=61654 RepID=A0A9W6ITL7_9HYPH|nr:DNA polymerase III subunit gamma/tau [Methylopila capsulata]MBM7851990.1 DNA polymerase-3 subunit gamma/tau [Methylopila capsulata]GLK55055.1 DNA polymerase III subunit gamma/tau [Methylopila capsulata]